MLAGCTDFQAGLLTSGSFYLLRLPICRADSGLHATFVPGHSGGPVPESHRVPFFIHVHGA